MTNKRKRPGKSQRANTVAKAVRIVRTAKVTANQAMLDAEKAKPSDYAAKVAAAIGPGSKRHEGRLSGSCDKARLKLGSYGVGFQGPRGFASPTGKVSRSEADGQAMAPRQALAITAQASKRFAQDDYETPKPERGIKRRKGKGQWVRRDLNESQPAPHDAATERLTGAARRERVKSLNLKG